MGLFSGKTIISVASSVYNLAGDELDRPNYLQTLILRNILSGTKRSLGETIVSGYIHGPGIKFRSFFRWALDNYDLIGMPTGQMYAGDALDTNVIAGEIPVGAGEAIWVQSARIGDSDYEMWAEQYMLANHPDIFGSNWEADMDDITKTITIKFDISLPAMPNESFVASSFVSGAKYIFAYYTLSKLNIEEPVVIGSTFVLGSSPFPSVVGYTLISDVTTNRTETLDKEVTVVKSYSDGRPDETSSTPSSVNEVVGRRIRIYHKETFIGNEPGTDSKISNRDIRRLVTDKLVNENTTVVTVDEVIAGGVTRTTTTTTVEEVLDQNNSYRDDTQKIIIEQWEPLASFIYRIGSGNAVLDALLETTTDYGKFFPMIPMRINNKFVSELATEDTDGIDPNWQAVYELAKKAFRKGTDGGKYAKVEANLNDSEDIADMDYIYTVYGVSLNCLDKSARRYIFEFFKKLQNDQIGGLLANGDDFATQMAEYAAAYAIWLAWRSGGSVDPEPPLPPKPTLPMNEIKIQSLGADGGTNINYDIRLIWNFINEGGEHTGKGKTSARKNDLWLEYLGETVVEDPTYTGENSFDDEAGGIHSVISDNSIKYDTIRIWWQFENNKYKYIDIAGLVHKNYVYGGKNVTITAKEALADGEESGFLIPLHYATFKSMPLIHATQMSTACLFLVINCYQTKKTKWWQSGFFQIIFVIVVAIISVVFTGGAGIGLLGSHLAVGSALGLTGMSAAIAGSIANALAALVLTTILEKLTSSLGVFGAILGTVLGIVIGGAMTNFTSGSGFTFNFSELMKADNILKLMNSVGNGYQAYIQASISGMQEDLLQLQEDANAELKRVREAYVDQFGSNGGQIDPMMFTSINTPAKYVEMRDTFLARTLMTGGDVADMSKDLLNNMADLTLSLPNAFSS